MVMLLLWSLDLSAAFDTVDYIRHFWTYCNSACSFRYHIPLTWFSSFLTSRTQSVCVNDIQSASSLVACSVPRGSVLGPLAFIAYIDDVVDIFRRNCVRHHPVSY